jgi:hypothetical protein
MCDTASTDHQRARDLKKVLLDLSSTVTICIALLDRLGISPMFQETGEALALIANALDRENDAAQRFGLGLSFPAIARRKHAATTLARDGEKT